jgi:hypothetical protein
LKIFISKTGDRTQDFLVTFPLFSLNLPPDPQQLRPLRQQQLQQLLQLLL